MKKENELALIIAYYISKYDREGIQNLGYLRFNDAYRDIEKKLGVKATSIKNRRDEFDPIHDNDRVGWYQRPMSPSRIKIVEMFSSISEPTLRGVVKDIIRGDQAVAETLSGLLRKPVSSDIRIKGRKYVLRGPTGRKAEQLFETYFNKKKTQFKGVLVDCRDLGEGYDFRISSNNDELFVEVKGLDGYSGGVVFTDKEWRTAAIKGDMYYLVVIAGVSGNPEFHYLQNPVAKFNPKRNINTSITVSWSIPQSQIMEKK